MKSLKMTAKMNRKYVEPGKPHTLLLLIDLEAADAKPREGRLPLNLGFVIDRSGSMGGEKLAYTKQAVQYAAGHLTGSDIASLTVFDDKVEVLYPASPVKLKDELKGIVSQIFPGGTTNLSGGMLAGYKEVKKNAREGQVDRVLLLTDGLANQGITDAEKLCKKAEGMRKSGVAVTTLGVGDDFDEDLLTALAEKSGGNYYFIGSADNIPEIFSRELQELLSVVAQNVKVTFDCSDVLTVTKVWNYPPEGDRILNIGLPDLVASDRKILVMELQVEKLPAGENPLGRITLSYDDAGESLESVELGLDLRVTATQDEELLASPEESEVLVHVELCRTAEAREEALKFADKKDFGSARAVMDKKLGDLRYQLSCASEELQKEIEEEIAFVAETQLKFSEMEYDASSRKMMASRSYRRRSNKKP